MFNNNTSGVTGVHWQSNAGIWIAQIGVGHKRESFASHSIEEFVAWRLTKEEVLGCTVRDGVSWSFFDNENSDDDMVTTSSLKKSRLTGAIIDSDDEL